MRTLLFSLLTPSCWSIIGLILNGAGVIVLFRFAMPFRIEAEGSEYSARDKTDKIAAPKDRRYKTLAQVGLGLVLIGTLCQIVGSFLSGSGGE